MAPRFDVEEIEQDPSIIYGKILANPPPGHEVVISGISGKFPESETVYEFRDNLFNKINMVTGDDRRWHLEDPEIPQNTGKLKLINKFDPGYFGVHQKHIDTMDPMIRIFLEKSVEAIMDAGLNPKELEGSRTGVFVGACMSESEKFSYYQNFKVQASAITGCERSMIPNRVSYYLKLKGPSVVLDTACSSSMYAVEEAYRAIRSGICDNALVGGANLCLHPMCSLQFKRLGVLSDDGACKVFDNEANGYARSEGNVCFFLQKSQCAKRIYATIVHAKTNCDGYKEQGITFPSSQKQKELLEEFYEECPVGPQDISYLEAHGTGTAVGDPEELAAIEQIFLKDRQRPLLIGSVKSQIGHNEPASGVSGMVKSIIAMETGYIPPNINFDTPRKTVKALMDGRLKVVTEAQPLPDNRGLIGVDSFGFGGANGHVLLQWNEKSKLNHGVPSDDIPRLVCVSSRTEEGLVALLDDLKGRKLDAEYVWMLQQTFRVNYENHHYRGFSLASKTKSISRSWTQCLEKQPIFVNFSLFDDPNAVFSALIKLPIFERFLLKFYEFSSKNNTVINSTVVHLGILYLLKELEVDIENISGCSEAVKAYYNNILTLDTAISSILSRTHLQNGGVAPQNSSNKNKSLILNIGDQGTSTFNFDSKGLVLENFLETIGRLYLHGHSPQIHKLYPAISIPVSRGTPMISPLIKWHHSKDWFVCRFQTQEPTRSIGAQSFHVNLDNDKWTFVEGHNVDGRNLFPATGYLYTVWLTIAKSQRLEVYLQDMPVVFENVRFVRATTVPKFGNLELEVMVQKGSGNFEVSEGDSVVVSGRVFIPEKITDYQVNLPKLGILENNPRLNKKDIYKELRLRGYNYKGAFKQLVSCNNSTTIGEIKWEGNWISFMDNMLQMKILQLDTRLLYVPTFIERLSIDPPHHLKFVESFGEDTNIPVYNHTDSDIVRSGGIEIRGLMASSIPKRKPLAEPILEKYIFVPNEANLSLSESLRVNVQIILDNVLTTKVKGIEVVDEETTGDLLSPLIIQALEDLPLIQPELRIFSDQPLEVKGINVENKKLPSETDCQLIIGSKILQRPKVLLQVLGALRQDGYILSRESEDYEVTSDKLDVITTHYIGDCEKLVLCQKPFKRNSFIAVNADDIKSFSFVSALQEAVKSNADVIVYSQEPSSGILGLVNCLRREPNGNKIRAVFTMDKDLPAFDSDHPFYKRIIDKQFATVVYKNGQWGTYRHLLLEENQDVSREHCYVNVTAKGDLSSLRWIEGPLSSKSVLKFEQILVKNYYAALNFKDIMTATGRINADVTTTDRLKQECVQGFEFAGRDLSGRRVMGMVTGAALSTLVAANPSLLWTVPDSWSLEEAATVPCVYCTVIYGLLIRGTIKKGSSILIHAGSGGIGLAAISIALYHGCEVFTTVGTKEKKEFLLKRFPELKENHIGNSRDISFEFMIKKETNGRGVDIVLNSLAEEKLLASARCLAPGGQFVEIGRFDLASNNQMKLILLNKEASFRGVMLDQLFDAEPGINKILSDLLINGIRNGTVKPLPTTVFAHDEIEQAFRFMASGKHIGKVLVKINQEEKGEMKDQTINLMKAIPRYYCDPDKVQVITGGLGGFGLELVDWLILRGARQLILSSRTGVKTGYQAYRLRIWKSYGVIIKISQADITSEMGCKELLQTALELGEVESIFNLAVVLEDAVLENQSHETFQNSFGPKAFATNHFDKLTRQLCPSLRDFVVFSSVSCGRGNAGQPNYGMANSVMERICEKRYEDGYPALAIEWGAIGEVGLVADLLEDNFEMQIGGTLQQRISSCLEVMDKFLRQGCPIVSSMVVAEKQDGRGGADNIIDAVANILGIKDIKTVSFQSTLAELGMDSMSGVEIKTMLEREFEIFLTAQDIRAMTFARLQEIQNEQKVGVSELVNDPFAYEMIFRLILDEETSKLATVMLPNKNGNGLGSKVLLFPGIDGAAKTLELLTLNLSNINPIGFQFGLENPQETMSEIIKQMLSDVEMHLIPGTPFQLVGYSFGAAIAIEIAAHLESKGYSGTVFCIDGSPEFGANVLKTQFDLENEALFQTYLLSRMLTSYISPEEVAKNYESILQAKTFEERLEVCTGIAPKDTNLPYDYLKNYATAFYKRLKALAAYQPNFAKLRSKIVLLKPTLLILKDFPEDYRLGELCSQEVEIRTFEGDHFNILENLEVAQIINEAFGEQPMYLKKNMFDDSRKFKVDEIKQI